MAKLTFTQKENTFVSEDFAGGVSLQFVFDDKATHVVFLDSRLSDELPWTLVKSLVVKPQGMVHIPLASEGMKYRLRSAIEPESVDTSKITSTGGGGGSSSGDIEDDFVPEDFAGIGEDETLDIVNNAIANAESGGDNQGGEP